MEEKNVKEHGILNILSEDVSNRSQNMKLPDV